MPEAEAPPEFAPLSVLLLCWLLSGWDGAEVGNAFWLISMKSATCSVSLELNPLAGLITWASTASEAAGPFEGPDIWFCA